MSHPLVGSKGIMFSGRLFGCLLTRISRDTMSVYVVDGSQLNSPQIFVM